MDASLLNGINRGRSLGLRNWRVRSKLVAVLVIPAVAFLVLASFGIGASVRNAQEFDQGRRLAGLGRQVTALVHELQAERDLSAGVITSTTEQRELDNALAAQQQRVDQAASAYRAAEEPLYSDLGARLQGRFDAVRAGLDELPGLREAASSESLTAQATFQEYSQIVGVLLDVNGEIAEPGGDENLAQAVTATNDLSRAKEVASQVRGSLYGIGFGEGFVFGGFQDFSDLLARQRAAFDQFQADANEAQRALFADAVQGQAVLAVDRIQQQALNTQSGPADAQQWLAASTTQIELLRTLESRLLDGVVDQASGLSSSAQRQAVRDAVLIAVILAVALLALLLVARSMARPLQKLRAGALEIAEHRLPEAVERLRTTETGDLDVRVEPLGIRSKDEIGQVAQAVDEIQEVAVRLATEQAALRRSIGDMFTNLARRSQTLIDRQLELIDDLERNEADPETLEHLFRLDHLATRMRRNAEDLIVLSGADPGRHWAQRMTLVDVVRAAAAEVEEYQRVEFLPLADLEVAGHASVDVIHLLAEIIENATVFSPPNTKVQIAGQSVPHGYVIEIEDRGLGMSDEELIQANERLANPPEIDFALSRVLGLYVVGRLAQRHGIKVQLRHSWYGGVTALALLPHSLLVWPREPAAIAEPAAGAVAGGRAELPSPAPVQARAAEPAGPRPGDHLPIFEAARSDWFATDAAEQPPMQHRQRQHAAAAGGDGDGVGGPPPVPGPAPTPGAEESRPYRPVHARADDQPLPYRRPPAARTPEDPSPYPAAQPAAAAPEEPPAYRPVHAASEEPLPTRRPPVPRADEPPPHLDEPPPRPPEPASPAAEPAWASSEPPPAPAPEPAPTPAAPAEPPAAAAATGPRLTQAGLPRRVPRANLAPGMVASQQTASQAAPSGPEPAPSSGRSPEEVRSMLSSYRTGLERGRSVAGGADAHERPQDDL
jgi:Nitrate and nitrite sensing/HAMP domain